MPFGVTPICRGEEKVIIEALQIQPSSLDDTIRAAEIEIGDQVRRSWTLRNPDVAPHKIPQGLAESQSQFDITSELDYVLLQNVVIHVLVERCDVGYDHHVSGLFKGALLERRSISLLRITKRCQLQRTLKRPQLVPQLRHQSLEHDALGEGHIRHRPASLPRLGTQTICGSLSTMPA